MQEELSFGKWVRQQRHILDLTQQELADLVGCARITLRRIEAGTLKPSKELAQILLEKLGTPSPTGEKWLRFARGLSGFPEHAVDSSTSKPITNLPTFLTTFIGREKEQLEVIKLIAKHRLVTLTGPGGVGKTRLSIKVAEKNLDDDIDGVWLVELAPILDPGLVSRTTAIAFGLRDERQRPAIDMLCDYLREKKLLLILDNCEHLVGASAQLADTLLKNCEGLKILATSRESLGILGEAIYRVPSLELPDDQRLLENFREYESVRLFEERAQLAQTNFSLTMENTSDIVKICTYLGGIPLAIELAAARIATFSTKQIAERLQESFRLLNVGNRTALPRHQTLQAAIDWSYDLLSPAEQTLFQRLSIFVNGWTLEAVKSICSDSDLKSEDMLDLLSQLISKSLINMEETRGKARYGMLETIRQYANEKLVQAGQRDLLRHKHLKYFLNLAQTAEPHLIRPEQLEWLSLLDNDYENLRLAFEWSLSKERAQQSLNFCKALWWFWKIRCRWLEGLGYLQRALAEPSQNGNIHEKVARARALYTHADLEWQSGNLEEILAPAQASLTLATEVADKKDIAIARFYVGIAVMRRGEEDQAYSLIKQSIAEFEVIQEPFWQAASFAVFGLVFAREEKRKLQEVCLRYLELARQAGERWILSDALTTYADWLFRMGRIDEAKKYANESDELYKQLNADNANINPFLFADIAWIDGDTQKARSLYLELEQRLSLLGEKSFRTLCLGRLGILAMEDGDLRRAQEYLEIALMHEREAGAKPGMAFYLIELGNVFYRQGNIEAFKQNFRESLLLKNYIAGRNKSYILMTMLGSLYISHPKQATWLLGILDKDEKEFYLPRSPVQKRYCLRAETHARQVLGDTAFESAFAEGQKMSLDEGLDLAMKTVEEM